MRRFAVCMLALFGMLLWPGNQRPQSLGAATADWQHLSTETGDLPLPGASTQQTASLIFDVNLDGINDFVIGSREGSEHSLVWFRRESDGWSRFIIEDDVLGIEAGGAYHDIDGDGDSDIVMGGDYQSNQVWWWENPYPNYDSPWPRRLIKDGGLNKHHDQIFGDFDGDGSAELVFWNQLASSLFLAEIPAEPKATQPWSYTAIYNWSGGEEHEGLAAADMDGDGVVDIVGGGRWFKHTGGTNYSPNLIADSQRFSRVAVGDLINGGRPEVVFVKGDGIGPLELYQWLDNQWIGSDLLGYDVDHGHSLAVIDLNQDGSLDVFSAEMRLNGGNPDAHTWLFAGDGTGNFVTEEIANGYGNHESKVGDLDGDGDLDILGKPYNWDTPRLDIWLYGGEKLPLDRWQRHVVDDQRPWRALFVTGEDVDGDQLRDIVTGGWWYRNPGSPSDTWPRSEIGLPLRNMATVYDFDSDGDVDILGTGGEGSQANDTFYWAENDGAGSFAVQSNVESGDGDFLQGVAVFSPAAGGTDVALSWHEAGKGVQQLDVPASPSDESWPWSILSTTSQDEDLSTGDIDRDGDEDLLLGTLWLRNDGGTWTMHLLSNSSGAPDRNELADINGDGRLDAVVGYEAVSVEGKLAWYEQGAVATDLWTEHLIPSTPLIGPMSLDVADLDQDGDLDVVVGEHNTANPASAGLYIFENVDGSGGQWQRYTVYVGDEHHDGARLVDIDGDGDLDILSIGWTHDRVLLYENLARESTADPGDGWTMFLPAISLADGSGENDPPPPSERVTDGQQALYSFQAGSGTAIIDRSTALPALPLAIADISAVNWLDDGLEIVAPTLIVSDGPAEKLITASRASNALTVEAWITPANITQDGPARIVSLSGDVDNRNFTLGQGQWGGNPSDLFDMRLRTTATDANGMPSLTTPVNTAGTRLLHVVYTRDSDGTARFYVDGQELASGTVGGDLSNWNPTYRLSLADEVTGDRSWLGTLHLIAIFDRALESSEVMHNYEVGPVSSALTTTSSAQEVAADDTVIAPSWEMGESERVGSQTLEPTVATEATRITQTSAEDDSSAAPAATSSGLWWLAVPLALLFFVTTALVMLYSRRQNATTGVGP